MTSRFRSNWAKEGPKSTSPTFDSLPIRNHPNSDDFRNEYYDENLHADSTSKRKNGSRVTRDSSLENRNGKLRGRNGGSCYGDERELDNDSESPERNCYRRYKDDFRCRSVEAEESTRERRPLSGKKGASNFATSAKYDLVEDEADMEDLETRLPGSALTNGNSSLRLASNGSSKQVNRSDERRGASGSLTREDPSSATRHTVDVTNRSTICTNDRSNGNDRERSVKRLSRNEKNDKIHESGAAGRIAESNDYGSADRRRSSRTRNRSQSPIDDVTNGNGKSYVRNSERRRKEERFYSPGDVEVSGSMDRRSRRHAEGRSFSPPEEEYDRALNGNSDILPSRLERKEKRSKDEEFVSITRRSSREHRDINPDDENEILSIETNGRRRENGNGKRYSEIDNDDNSLNRKDNSKRKIHSHRKASPEDFDVQIHRYERAVRAPRRDSDLNRKSSFKDHDSDLSRKNSFEDHNRSREGHSSKKNSHRRRDTDTTRRGSSEDRDHEQVGRKSSFKNRDSSSTRKSSLTNRNLLDTGPMNNNNSRNNGSHHRDHSESSRRERDSSSTRRRSSRSNNNDEEDLERSFWKNDRHSRPLTPPTSLNDIEDDSRDRKSRIAASSSSRDRYGVDDDDFPQKYSQDRSDYRGKIHDDDDLTNKRDRYSSSTRRVVSTRLFNESHKDDSSRSSRIDAGNKSREPLVDEMNSGFSTIERNGTTVIKIRTNSESPVGHAEPRSRRRTSHQEVGATRYRKYEDEAEDEDEDDEIFERNNQRRDEGSRRNCKVGPRRLWSNRDESVQITDLDDGQPCLHCGETCPGFSPHSWRKNCTSCKCPREAHDVCHEEWVSVRARLGLKGEGPNNHVGFDPRDRGLTWAPPGLSPSKVEEYYSMLPEISVPRIGTPGERHRDRQLATQLPKQDLARAYCRHLDSQHSASADDFMAARNEIALDIGSVKEILERGHKCGVCHEPLKYGSLVVSASKLGLSYHPSCFQCTQCRELLVDLAYCVHDDALYCERHYAEQLKPRCAACDELIFSGEYTKAMNKDWHSGHFCCWQCDESLTGQRYVLRDEHPYCIKCYESVFANGCEECSKIIGIDSKDLSYKDKHWHEACFLCNKCRVSLVDKQFGSKVDKIYCGNCYDAQFASRCDGCGEIFRAGTKKMEYKTRQWHEKCFCCVVCKAPIGTKSFIPREQEIYCAGCYEDKFATRCVKCNKIITSGGVTYKNEPWHRDCFTCSNCNNSLAGQRFTSRDDKPYCAECFGELFAKRCTACTKPITGIGGTRFISFEDRHWHNNCFICAGCNTSLVGRGFITDGDDIICPECAKQKLSE